ncbi:hypothetical protein [Halomonas sp. I5-271120]|uniref:hypothetical protein n=1 Tax=Halomonas sp. I5-271120 TaxID=3061632 RepID=UPI00271464B2|nr:hypothetical protein [Halomonas sp. I5-271120]
MNVFDRYLTWLFEANGFRDADVAYNIGFCQGDHCTLKRANVSLSDPKILEALWPVETASRIHTSADIVKCRRMHEVIRALEVEFEAEVSLSPFERYSLSITTDIPDIVNRVIHDEDEAEIARIAQLSQLSSEEEWQNWAEDLERHVVDELNEFAKSLGSRAYSTLSDAILSSPFQEKPIQDRTIGDYSVKIEAFSNDNDFEFAFDMLEDDDHFLSILLDLSKRKLTCASIRCVIEHLPSGEEASHEYNGIICRSDDPRYEGLYWDVFAEAKAMMREIVGPHDSSMTNQAA